MTLRVDELKARLSGGGARPNLFRAFINFPEYVGGDTGTTSFLCKAAQLPASVMAVIEVPFRGRQLKIAGDRTFETWSVTIINDTDFSVRNAMERWMSGINAHSANTGFTNPIDYQANLQVQQLGKDETVLKTYNFVDAFPTNVGAIDLSYETTDAIEEFTVEFQYQYWTTLDGSAA
jgi:hypothetical protein